MSTTTPKAPKKDFWAPFRTDFKTFVSLTRKASAAGFTTAVGTTGAVLGGEIAAAKGNFDFSSNVAGLAFTFVGAFIAGFAGAYATSNAG